MPGSASPGRGGELQIRAGVLPWFKGSRNYSLATPGAELVLDGGGFEHGEKIGVVG